MKKEDFEMKTTSTVLFALLLASFAPAQQRWSKTYGGTANDYGWSAQQTRDGGYIVTGESRSFGSNGYDVYLVKTDAAGDTVWTRTCGGEFEDDSRCVRQTADGGYIIAGYTASFGAQYTLAYLVKTDSLGSVTWQDTLGGNGKAGWNMAYSVQQTVDGGYIVTGYTDAVGAGYDDVWLIKTNSSGSTSWTKTFGGADYDNGYAVQQTSDSGYIIAGQTKSFGAGAYDVYLIKTNSSGDTLWTRTYGGTGNDAASSVRQTADGGYIVTGYTQSFGSGADDVWLLKTNASGDTLWTRTYGGTGYDDGNSVQPALDGGYIIAGTTPSPGPGGYDFYLIRTGDSGDTAWTRTYGGAYDDEGRSVQQTSDGGYIIAGYSNSFGAGDYDVYLVKTDENGSPGVEEKGSGRPVAAGSLKATPNPFNSFATIPGYEGERFSVYDISGKMVGTCLGNRVGEGLAPAVYFVKPGNKQSTSLRIVKAR